MTHKMQNTIETQYTNCQNKNVKNLNKCKTRRKSIQKMLKQKCRK